MSVVFDDSTAAYAASLYQHNI